VLWTFGVFGFLSNLSTLLDRDNRGQPGVALRQLRAPGRGATAHGTGSRLIPPPGEISKSMDVGLALLVTVWKEPFNMSALVPPLVPLWNQATSGPVLY
jgi:hypothetical protein